MRTSLSFLSILPQHSEDHRIASAFTAGWLGVAAFSSEARPRPGDSTATPAHLECVQLGLRQSSWLYGRVLRDHNEITRTCGNVAGAAATQADGEALPSGLEGKS